MFTISPQADWASLSIAMRSPTKKPPPLVLTASELSLGLKSPATPNQGFRKAKTGDLPPFEGGPDGPDASEARDAEGAEAPTPTPVSSAREVVHLQKTGSDYIDRGDEPDAARRRGMI